MHLYRLWVDGVWLEAGVQVGTDDCTGQGSQPRGQHGQGTTSGIKHRAGRGKIKEQAGGLLSLLVMRASSVIEKPSIQELNVSSVYFCH